MNKDGWQKVREVFDAALRQPPENRLNYARQACGDDQDLLREVESLFSSLDSSESFMEKPAVAHVAEVISRDSETHEPGTSFGHYEIIRQIGAGGMGDVYLAKDKKLDRQVAIKILNAEYSRHESNLNRFIQEAKSASALNHPNILVVHEVGSESETHFIVSEYIQGKTLREILNESTPQLREILDIAIQTASALGAAHEAGLVHRDIKPENIMVRPDGYSKILDFGLAKLVERQNESLLGSEESTVKQNRTAQGLILGTISYMSPEQARGKEIDARTDIWSLGVVLYEMLAGKPPFGGETTGDKISEILTKNPAPLAAYVPEMPAELERVVGKTLRKNREERYQHVKDLLIDLKDFKQELEFNEKLERSAVHSKTNEITTAKTAVPAQATSSAEYLVGEIRQHKRSALTALALLVLVGVGVGYWAFSNRAALTSNKQIESVAVMPFLNESGNADIEYLSDGMTETLISSLSQVPNLDVKAHSSVIRYKGKEISANTIANELKVQAFLNGKVRQRGNDVSLYVELVDAITEKAIWSQTYNRPMTNLVSLQSEIAVDVAGKLKTKLSGEDERRLAKNYTANPEAYQLHLRGNFHVGKRTEKEIRKGIEYLEQAIAIDPNYARAHAGLASAYVALPNYSKVPWREVMPKVKDATLKALSLDNDLSEAHTMLGFIMTTNGDDVGAEREYQQAIELDPNSSMAHHFYCQLLYMHGKLEEALAHQRRALEIDPLSLIVNREYGSKLYFSRRYDEAIAQFKKTIELDAGFASAHYGLAIVHQVKGNYDESVEAHAKYQELINEPKKAALLRESFAKGGWQGFLRTITDERHQFDLSWDSLTPYYAALGDKDKALQLLQKRFENRRARPGNLIDSRLEPLRDDPRFQELVKRAEQK